MKKSSSLTNTSKNSEKIKIFFMDPKKFELDNSKPLLGLIGLYFIFLSNIEIKYPFKKSKLIYIGMSEKKTNSIGNRLAEHISGQSGNLGIINYAKIDLLNFTYINFEMLKNFWKRSIEDLESYFILDFVNNYGVYPICNNKTVYKITKIKIDLKMDINWHYFEEKR